MFTAFLNSAIHTHWFSQKNPIVRSPPLSTRLSCHDLEKSNRMDYTSINASNLASECRTKNQNREKRAPGTTATTFRRQRLRVPEIFLIFGQTSRITPSAVSSTVESSAIEQSRHHACVTQKAGSLGGSSRWLEIQLVELTQTNASECALRSTHLLAW